MVQWKVMPLCKAQLTDINQSDILADGLYRKCNTYKGGGGYDKFPEIYQRRYGAIPNLNNQFVVQLMGCPLRCPYCYVTPEGIHGQNYKSISTDELINAYIDSGCSVFHLMGGAPALYIENWVDIIDNLPDNAVFHSDLLLVEKEYNPAVISELASRERTLYAVSIKGGDALEFVRNTGIALDTDLFWLNFDLIVARRLPVYLTFTGMSDDSINNFKSLVQKRYGDEIIKDSFGIDLVHYNALDYTS